MKLSTLKYNLTRRRMITKRMEQWKDVVGYEGYYQVSSNGNVRSVDRVVVRTDGVRQRRKGKALAKRLNDDGYVTVHLCRDGDGKRVAVHRLVALAFIPNPTGLPEVNHKDFNRTNNSIDNLEWVDHKENVQKSIDAGRHICTTDLSGNKNPNYGNRTLHNRYKEDKQFALDKQSRPRSRNGRATPVIASNAAGVYGFPCMMDCADYLISVGATSAKPEHIVANICVALKQATKYLGYSFERA